VADIKAVSLHFKNIDVTYADCERNSEMYDYVEVSVSENKR